MRIRVRLRTGRNLTNNSTLSTISNIHLATRTNRRRLSDKSDSSTENPLCHRPLQVDSPTSTCSTFEHFIRSSRRLHKLQNAKPQREEGGRSSQCASRLMCVRKQTLPAANPESCRNDPTGTGLRTAVHVACALRDASGSPLLLQTNSPLIHAWMARIAACVSSGWPWRSPITSKKDAASSRASAGSRSTAFTPGSSSHSNSSTSSWWK